MNAVAGEPRQQRRVLDRVPAPVAAPAEHLVAPPRAEDDADGEEAPRDERRAARVGEPALAEAAGDRAPRSRTRTGREPDVARGRASAGGTPSAGGSAAAGSGPRPSSGDRAVDRLERVGRRPSMSTKKNSATHEPHERRPRDERIVGAVAEAPRRDREVAGEDEHPQQDRALERGPQPGDREEAAASRARCSRRRTGSRSRG